MSAFSINIWFLIIGTCFIFFLITVFIFFLITSNRRLKVERDKATSYLDLASVIFLALNKHGKITLINPKGCQILGYQDKELLGKNWFVTCLSEDVRKDVQTTFKQLMAGKLESLEYFENNVLTKSGKTRTIAWHNSFLTDSRGNVVGTLSSGEDITERKHLEAQLFQAQKMEAIGRLAGGIAHDFNNLLTVINGYANFLLEELKEDSKLYEDVEEILKAGTRAEDLTRQLLAFSRHQIFDVHTLDLNDIIQNLEKMLRRIIAENIDLVIIPAKNLGSFKADPGQIEQVILNLTVNARDAMINGGILTIEANNVTLDSEYAETHYPIKPGDYVMLSVSDTGIGMSDEVQKKIFEPFFTTKRNGKGTGLGLSTVYGIVKQSNGYIWVCSDLGKGTTFKIYLPRCEEMPESINLNKKAEISPSGTETICVIEDELSVRKMACRVLKQNGYTVLSAENGDQAIQVFKRYKKSIHLIVTDVVMPGINGKELADKLKLMQPDTKVLFISGYTDNTIVHHGILDEKVSFLQKPFSQLSLLKKVRETLET